MILVPFAFLQELTERKRAAAVAAELNRMGIRFKLGADGTPQVIEDEIKRHMLSGESNRRPAVVNREALAAAQQRASA